MYRVRLLALFGFAFITTLAATACSNSTEIRHDGKTCVQHDTYRLAAIPLVSNEWQVDCP